MPPTRQLRCSRTACRLQQEPEATQRAMGRWRYEREGETKAKRGRAACCSECTAAGRQKTRQGKAGLTRGVPIAVLAALAPRGSSALRRGERGGGREPGGRPAKLRAARPYQASCACHSAGSGTGRGGHNRHKEGGGGGRLGCCGGMQAMPLCSGCTLTGLQDPLTRP